MFDGEYRETVDHEWIKDTFEITLGERDFTTDGIYYNWENKPKIFHRVGEEYYSNDVFYGNHETLQKLFNLFKPIGEELAEMYDEVRYEDEDKYSEGFNGSFGDYLELGDAAGAHDQWLENSINSNR